MKALVDTGGSPLDVVWSKIEIDEILAKLGTFKYTASDNACRNCKEDYEKIIRSVIKHVRTYFDGLCLDCMDSSKAKTIDYDSD